VVEQPDSSTLVTGTSHFSFVLIRWQGRTMGLLLSQLAAVDPDESTAEAIGDWHYWISQGYCF
jgi:Calcium binding